MINRMDTPDTRAEFERRFHLLREQIMSGKFRLARGMKMLETGLLELRYLPNGRLDLLSVNEFTRLHANMTAQMEGMVGKIPQRTDTGSDTELDVGEASNTETVNTGKKKGMPKSNRTTRKKGARKVGKKKRKK